ncbi:hypothetical protein HDU96_005277 [Phlyctochytrium bullatum]|nr:hypothetical protein HDU96_005277 [Phlyctochytrium bullatum]
MSEEGLLDSGAIAWMTPKADLFENLQMLPPGSKNVVYLADDRSVPIYGIGDIVYDFGGHKCRIRNALYVPDLVEPLCSVAGLLEGTEDVIAISYSGVFLYLEQEERSIDPGERVFVTAVDENRNAFQFRQKLTAFMSYANHQIAARDHFISTELEKHPRVMAKRKALKDLEARLQGQVTREVWDSVKKKMDACVKEIGQLKANLEKNEQQYEKLKGYRADINHLHDVIKQLLLYLRPGHHTQVRHRGFDFPQPNQGLCKRAKTNLNRFSHESLLKLIQQKVEAVGGKVLVTSEAFTTKTCSCCGHQQHVGAARVFSCKNKSCGAVMDRDVNTFLRVVQRTRQQQNLYAAEEFLLLQTTTRQKPICKVSTAPTLLSTGLEPVV